MKQRSASWASVDSYTSFCAVVGGWLLRTHYLDASDTAFVRDPRHESPPLPLPTDELLEGYERRLQDVRCEHEREPAPALDLDDWGGSD